MTRTATSMVAMWEAALELEERPADAIALLADACAFGLSEGDFHPDAIIERLRHTFDQLHFVKHIGVRQ